MNYNMPVISVIMPVYNGRKYLKEAVDSILNQTYTDFEFLIIDDASTDGSSEILFDYSLKDSRVKIFKNEKNLNVAKSLNRLIDHAKGKYIARMDADDVAIETRLESQLEVLETQSSVDILFSNIIYIDKDGHEICLGKKHPSLTKTLEQLSLNNSIAHPTIFMRKNVFDTYGGYNEEIGNVEDKELWMRLHQKGVKFYFHDRFVLKYRINPSSVTYKSSHYFVKLGEICLLNYSGKEGMRYLKYYSLSQKILYLIKFILGTRFLRFYVLLKRRTGFKITIFTCLIELIL